MDDYYGPSAARRRTHSPRREFRRPVALTGAIALVAYGAFVGPSAAAPSDAECGALATQMRALGAERIDEVLERHAYDQGSFGEGNAEFSGLSLGNDDGGPPPEDPLPVEATEAVGAGPTGTNIAERDVDEPDIAKVDGTRVLRLWGHRDRNSASAATDRAVAARHTDWELSVVETASGRPRLTGWFKPALPHTAHELFLLGGHRVLVVGSVDKGDPGPVADADADAVVLSLLDVSDAANPVLLRTSKVTGRYISSRLADGVVRLVLSTRSGSEVSPPKGIEPKAVAAGRNRVALLRKDGRDWLPQRELLDARGEVVSAGPALECADVHRPADPRGMDILSVLAIDSNDGAAALDRAGASGLVGGGDVVYAATDRLYVASGGPDATVHAFDTTGRHASPHVGTGTVAGRLIGSSALSRYDGHLRVAVTDGRVGSSVHVLAEEGVRLRDVGRVTNLGPGEEIRSVRWFGPLATVVTFRQTDPFYVVDLSRPTAPRLRGAVKIPGYSGYLHPAGGGRVLGVGQDADRNGTARGLQISSFDVTDPAAPRRTDNLAFRGGWGLAETDSRAFAYLPGTQVAVVPALLHSAGCPRAPVRCWSVDGEAPRAIGVPGTGRRGIAAAIAVALDSSGALREVARFRADSAVLRILPLPSGRLAIITDRSVEVVDAADLRPFGRVVLDPRV